MQNAGSSGSFQAISATTSARLTHGMSSYIYRIGGASYPIQKVTVGASNPGHAYAEMLKVFSSLGDIRQSSSLSTGVAHTDATCDKAMMYYPSDENGSKFSQYAFGCDFTNYPQDGATLESGLDLSSQSLPVVIELECTSTSDTTQLESFAMHDVIYTLSADGIMSKAD